MKYNGADVDEWLHDRSRWGELLDLIDRLPLHSFTKAAILNDPEQARLIAEASDGEGKSAWHPALIDFTPEHQAAAAVYDRLGELTGAVYGALGEKYKGKSYPRPVTAVDRAREQIVREAAEDLIALFGGRPK